MATPFKQEVLTLEERFTSIEKRLTDLENIFGSGTEPVQYSPLQNRSGLADTDNLEVSEEVESLPDFDLTEAKRLEAEATEDWFK